MYNTTDSTWTQVPTFIYLLCTGIVLGLIYTVVSAQKQHVKKKIWKNLHDIFFCIALFTVTGLALYIFENGKIHLYMVPTLAIGFYLGVKMFDNMVKTAINKAVSIIKFIKVQLNNLLK